MLALSDCAEAAHHFGIGDEEIADGGGEVVHASPAQRVSLPVLGLTHDATDPAEVPQVIADGDEVDRVEQVERLDELVRFQEREHRREVRRLDLDRRSGGLGWC